MFDLILEGEKHVDQAKNNLVSVINFTIVVPTPQNVKSECTVNVNVFCVFIFCFVYS